MNQRGLFDVRPVALARERLTADPMQDIGNVSDAPQDRNPASAHPALRPDVERVIVPRSGKPAKALISVDGDLVERDFWLVQLRDGRWFRQFLDDGSRGAPSSTVTEAVVERMLAQGVWTEVRG